MYKYLLVAIALVGFFAFWLIPGKPYHPLPEPKSELDSDKLWSLIQDWRMSQNLQTYIKDQRLCKFVKVRLGEIKENFSHKGFEDRSTNNSFPFFYQELGENLAAGITYEESILFAWLNSPSHRENLDKEYKYSCLETEGFYVIQLFANF